MNPRVVGILFALSLPAAQAHAVSIAYQAVSPEGAVQRQGFSIEIGESGVAVTPAETRGSGVIFLADSGEMRFVDHAHREYTVMTEEWLREARVKAEASMEETRRRLENRKQSMSPQMRSQVEQADTMMRMMPLVGGLLGGNASQTAYSRNGRSAEFNGIPCAQYDEMVDGEKKRIVCLAEPSQVGLAGDAAETLESFRQALVRIEEMGGLEFGFSRPEVMVAEALPGIVVAVSYPDGGGYIVAGPASEDDDPAAFEIPDSYLRAEIPMFGM